MHAVPQIANPFALLTDPEAIFRAVESSPRLESLNRRVCRPLDRAHREGTGDGTEATTQDAEADAVIDRESDQLFG
jgi:hypothetical protein